MNRLQKIVTLLLIFFLFAPPIISMDRPVADRKTTEQQQNNTLVPSLFAASVCALDMATFPNGCINNIVQYIRHLRPENFLTTLSLIHREELSPLTSNLEPIVLVLACAKESGKTVKGFYTTVLCNPQNESELRTNLGRYLFTRMLKNIKPSQDKAYVEELIRYLESNNLDSQAKMFMAKFHMKLDEFITFWNELWNSECAQWDKKREVLYTVTNYGADFASGFSFPMINVASTIFVGEFIWRFLPVGKLIAIPGMSMMLFGSMLHAARISNSIFRSLKTFINNKIALIHHKNDAIVSPAEQFDTAALGAVLSWIIIMIWAHKQN